MNIFEIFADAALDIAELVEKWWNKHQLSKLFIEIRNEECIKVGLQYE